MVLIRKETPADYRVVYQVNALAFDRAGEADLVDKLRDAGPYISLVAVADEQVVGHIFFSVVTVELNESNESGESDRARFTALGLAPMAVLPGHQNQGIGSQLVTLGLEECARQGHDVVFVLGHPNFYPRFGFCPAKAKGLSCEYPVPDEVFMVAELQPEALHGRTGLVKYSAPFADV